MALGGSFTNPQRVIDKSFNAFIEGGKNLTKTSTKTLQDIETGVKAEKEFQARQQQAQDTEMQGLYGKINKVPSSGNAALDNNIHAFWNDKVDEYFKIKNAMDKGTISRQEGNRALSKITNLSNQFAAQAKTLALNSGTYKEDLKNGTVSSLGSPETKEILSQLGKGGNVGIIERGGKLIYYTPETTDENGNVLPGAMLNGSEMEATVAGGGRLYENKVDISQNLATAFNKTYMPEDMSSEYVSTVTKTRDDWIDENDHSKGKYEQIPEGEEYTFQIIDEDGKAGGQKAMMESGILDPLLNNPSVMKSYWQDTIPDEWLKENGYDGIENTAWGVKPEDMEDEEWEKIEGQQMEAAKQYMANSSYDANATMDQKMKYIGKAKITPPAPKPSGKAPKTRYQRMTAKMQQDFEGKYQKKQALDNEFKNGDVNELKDKYGSMYTDKEGNPDPRFTNATTADEVLAIVKEYEGYDDTYNVVEQDYYQNMNPYPKHHKFKTKAEYDEAVSNGKIKVLDTVTVEDTNTKFKVNKPY